MKLPKILIFGQPFTDFTGGGITLSNLFFDWNSENLAIACTGHSLKRVNNNRCNNIYQLGDEEHRWIFPFYLIQRKFKSGRLIFENNIVCYNESIAANVRKWFVDSLFYPILKQIGLFHCMSKIKISNKFCRWIDNYKPDILYVQISTREEILFIHDLHSYLKIPLVIHMMDDWPSIITNNGILKKYWQKRIDFEFRMLLDKASLLMSISDPMSEEYKKRYRKEFIVFHNPVNIAFWKRYQKKDIELNDVPIFLYAGRIGIGIDSSLKLIANAIQIVKDELKVNIKFHIQTKEKVKWFRMFKCLEHRIFQPYANLPETFSKADFLILSYDFSEISKKYMKYSIPTKTSEYMISGVPILLFAPQDTAIVRLAKRFNVAFIVTDNDLRCLCEAIKELIKNEKSRLIISQNAIRVAEEKFDSIKIQMNFRKAIDKLWNE